MASSPHLALLRPLLALLVSQLRATAALAIAVTAVASVALAVDGRTPTADALLRLALPGGAIGGLTVAVTSWRRQAGDVALACLGLRPALLLVPAGLLAAALSMAAPSRDVGSPASDALTFSRSELQATVEGRALRIQWGVDGARMDGGGHFPTLPPPSSDATPGAPSWPRWPLWGPLVVALVAALAQGTTAPSLARGLILTGATVASAWLLGL